MEKLKTDTTPEIKTNVPNEDNTDKIDEAKAVSNKKLAKKTKNSSKSEKSKEKKTMSDKEPNKSREEVLAAREAKKLAKQKAKNKNVDKTVLKEPPTNEKPAELAKQVTDKPKPKSLGKDEVDRAVVKEQKPIKKQEKPLKEDAAKEVKALAGKIDAIKVEQSIKKTDIKTEKKEETTKSKAELKAERRAKQDAQREAKSGQKAQKVKVEKPAESVKTKEKPKPKTPEKTVKTKAQTEREVWFQHLQAEREEASKKIISINNTNIHPAVVKLGVQLAAHTIRGSNARCIALLNALREVIKDYTLPAKTEYSRGLEAYLTSNIDYLWSMRKPSSSQTNAIKYFRYQLSQLPNTINDYDAKSKLQEAIDTYIHEQIHMAGEAISLSVRQKITVGDNILTYDCSSLVERILKEAWDAGVAFRAVVVGTANGAGSRGREMLRRLTAHGIPVTYVDLTAVDFVMRTINKVILGASALLVNGWVMGVAGTSLLCLSARAYNVPVLVCCERHKFSERVQTDAFVYNELGDPDDLVDKSDENCPLREWRTNNNLTLLNIMYDVTPPSLVTAVVTDLAILPCSSAPVVLRFMLSEYGF